MVVVGQRVSEWDGERETSGQIPAAEEHGKCEKLRQTVDLGEQWAGSQTKGFVLHDVSETPQAGQAGSSGAGGLEATAEGCEGTGGTRGLGAVGAQGLSEGVQSLRAELGLGAGAHCTGGDGAVGEARRGTRLPRRAGRNQGGARGSVRESSGAPVGSAGCQRFPHWAFFSLVSTTFFGTGNSGLLTFVKVVTYLRTLCLDLPQNL